MVTHMKTTIVIADPLLSEAREVAAAQGTTLRALVEEGLRLALATRVSSAPFRLRDAAYRGDGLQPGIDLADWEQVLALIYEDRGV